MSFEYRVGWSADSNINFKGKSDWIEWDGREETAAEVENALDRGAAIGLGLETVISESGLQWYAEVREVPAPRETPMAERPDFFTEDPTAQDVIDALRLAFMANPERTRPLVETLLEFAPETDSSRGIDLLLRLIVEGTLRVEVAGAPDHPEEKP